MGYISDLFKVFDNINNSINEKRDAYVEELSYLSDSALFSECAAAQKKLELSKTLAIHMILSKRGYSEEEINRTVNSLL